MKLILAADQGALVLTVRRNEAAFGCPFADHPPGGDRPGEAVQLLPAEIVQLEGAGDQLPGLGADHRFARFCERL